MSDEVQLLDTSKPPGQLAGRLANLSLSRQIWKISFWPFIEQVLAFLVTASSLYIAGRLSEDPVTVLHITKGIGAASYIAMLGFVLQGAVAMGTTALIARLTGARKYGEANYAIGQTLLLGFLAGVLSCGIMLGALDTILQSVLELEEGAIVYAEKYMHIMAFSALFSGIVFSLNGALRGSGDTRTPFLIMAGINVVTAGLGYLLAWGPGFIGGHGVEGIAVGPVAGFFLGSIILVRVLIRNRKKVYGSSANPRSLDIVLREKGSDYVPPLCLTLKGLRPDWKMIWRIVRVGGAQAIEVFFVCAIQFYSLRIVQSLPVEAAFGAHTVVVRTESMSFLPGFAIGTASAALVGQYLGAGNPQMARLVVLKCMKYAVIFMGTFGVLFFLFPSHFVGIFAPNSPEIVKVGAPVLQVAAVVEFFFAASIVLKMSMRGAGDVVRVMLLALGSFAFWRVGVLTLWVKYSPETLTLVRIWILFGLDVFVQSIIFWKMFKGNKWARYEV